MADRYAGILDRPIRLKVELRFREYWSLLFWITDDEGNERIPQLYSSNNVESIARLTSVEWRDESSLYQHPTNSGHTDALVNRALAHEWVRVCTETHEECRQVANISHNLPSRLIDIGSENIRLCAVHDVLPNAQYATLSHCWGSVKFVTLTRNNLEPFRISIPSVALTKKFRDAIQVARRFGFRYLWIDSLCIVQDDGEDWAREAPRMADVYGGTSLNIAATGANDGREGLFFHRDENLVQRCVVVASDPRLKIGMNLIEFYARKPFFCTDGQLYDRPFDSLPLIRRAWIVQERLLSPRTLHFGSTQLIWECQSKICFATLPNGLVQNETRLMGGTTWVTAKEDGVFNLWRAVVSTYSKSLLSVGDDRLMAIAGVADSFVSRYGGHYLWGLWLEHLPLALMWVSKGVASRRSVPFRAPSWSWISIDGEVELEFEPELSSDICCTVLKSNISMNGVERWGLNIECERMLEVASIEIDKRMSKSTLYLLGIKARLAVAQQPKLWRMAIYFDEDDRETPKPPNGIYLLLCVHDTKGINASFEKGILVQAVDERKGYFRRLGVYRASYENCEGLQNERCKSAHDDDVSIYESKCVVTEAAKQMYTINIV